MRELESEIGRIPIPVPYDIAITMEPKERLKTAAFLKAECEIVISSPYRLTVKTINERFHRTNPSDMICLGTLYDDIIRCNCMDAKVAETSRILKAYGFDPETGMKIGGIEALPECIRNRQMDTIEIQSNARLVGNDGRLIHLGQPIDLPDPEVSIDGDDEVASVESEEDAHQYSCPDQRKFTPRRKARKKREPLCPDEVEEVLNGYLKWWNDQNPETHCRILHDWTVEQDPQRTVYIYLDGDCVFKQTPQRKLAPLSRTYFRQSKIIFVGFESNTSNPFRMPFLSFSAIVTAMRTPIQRSK